MRQPTGIDQASEKRDRSLHGRRGGPDGKPQFAWTLLTAVDSDGRVASFRRISIAAMSISRRTGAGLSVQPGSNNRSDMFTSFLYCIAQVITGLFVPT